MNIFTIKKAYLKAYLIGIKGVVMSVLAQILKSLKIKVVGSGTEEKFFLLRRF